MIYDEIVKYKIDVNHPPPLPDFRYRQQMQWVLKKFRTNSKIGFLRIAKEYLIPSIIEIVGRQLDSESNYLSQDWLRRKLEYWCGEDGDLKDALLVAFVGRMLEQHAPHLLQEFRYIPRMFQTAQAMAELISWTSRDELRFKMVQAQIEGRQQIAPGVYKRFHHNLRDDNKASLPRAFGYFVSIADVGAKDFYICNFFSLLPPFVEIATRFAGFIFHKSPNKIIITRALAADDSAPMQIEIAHLQYFKPEIEDSYVNIDKDIRDIYEASIIHHVYVDVPCDSLLEYGSTNHVNEYKMPIDRWRFDHLIKFNDEGVNKIADALKWDI